MTTRRWVGGEIHGRQRFIAFSSSSSSSFSPFALYISPVASFSRAFAYVVGLLDLFGDLGVYHGGKVRLRRGGLRGFVASFGWVG